jgi:GTPase
MAENLNETPHKSGFVNILGNPNVGKSTIMNELVGERLSIITSKAQTTRHRIMGIVNGEDFQIIYSDTPGIIKPISLCMLRNLVRIRVTGMNTLKK